jgi:hypothetical protein
MMLEGEGTTLSVVAKKCIDQFGYRLLKSSTDKDDLHFYLHISKTERYRTQLLIDEASRILDLRVYCTDSGYHPSKAPEIAELANRLNEDVPFSLFYQQVGSGAIVLKLTYDARKGATVEDIENWMNLAAFPLKVFSTAFDKIAHDGVDGEAAYGASLIENQIYSRKVLKKVRRAVLKLEKNVKDESPVLDDDTNKNVEIVLRDLGILS